MTWLVEYSGRARRDLAALDPPVARRVDASLSRLAKTGNGDLIALRGFPGQLRLRVGQWRVILTYDNQRGVIRVVRVLPREQAYR